MIFTNSEHNMHIELTDPFTCRLSTLREDMKKLEKFSKMLTFYARGAPLDGGQPVKFEHTLCLNEKHILVKGDISGVASALCELGWIEDNLRDDIIEQVMLMMASQVKARISPARQELFAEKLNTTLRATEQSHYTPGVFS